LEGNQNTFDAIQSRLPLSGMHQEVFSTIMFLQNKFHWEAFALPVSLLDCTVFLFGTQGLSSS